MVRLSRTRNVRAPQEKVFQCLTEVEGFPAIFPDTFSKMEVVGREGGSRVIACKETWAGRPFSYTMKEDLSPPWGIIRTIIRGSGTGTEVSIALSPSPGGTRVDMTVETRGLFASLCGGLSRSQFEDEVDLIFEGYMRVVEAGAASLRTEAGANVQ